MSGRAERRIQKKKELRVDNPESLKMSNLHNLLFTFTPTMGKYWLQRLCCIMPLTSNGASGSYKRPTYHHRLNPHLWHQFTKMKFDLRGRSPQCWWPQDTFPLFEIVITIVWLRTTITRWKRGSLGALNAGPPFTPGLSPWYDCAPANLVWQTEKIATLATVSKQHYQGNLNSELRTQNCSVLKNNVVGPVLESCLSLHKLFQNRSQ